MAGELFATEIAAMDLLTDRPTGGAIDVTLSWPAPPDSRTWRYVDRALLVLWLCGWAWVMVWPGAQVVNGAAHPFLVIWLSFWTLGGGVFVWTLLASFRPARPESVRLEAEVLRHDPGGRNWCWGRRERRDPVQVARSDVCGFVLERDGARPRLYLGRGTDRREIGAALTEKDWEWLLAVLRRWHEAEPAAAPDPAAGAATGDA
jgi:hypothetical protein